MADRVAVLAHRKKTLHGAGLDALREILAAAGVEDPHWYEVTKSRKAPKQARAALDAGADLVLVRGGDGMDDADPSDGLLEVGVTTASGVLRWARTLGRMTFGRSDNSAFNRITRGGKISVKLAEPMPVELDGGARDDVRKFTATVAPGALIGCVPRP